LDRGRTTDDGADFEWSVDDGARLFEIRNGAQLAPRSDISDLRNLSLDECASASFGEYTFLDGSDGAPDAINKLIEDRSACYRTNEGRLGKLWFPDGVDNNDELKVEWVTWK
jgi:hypothetical protein